jgi:hypothetical protein
MGDKTIEVESSLNNHFMYYSGKHIKDVFKKYPNWKPPQMEIPMTITQFLKYAQDAQLYKLNNLNNYNKSLVYFTISAKEGIKEKFITDSLPFFKKEESFFIVDPEGFKGIMI